MGQFVIFLDLVIVTSYLSVKSQLVFVVAAIFDGGHGLTHFYLLS